MTSRVSLLVVRVGRRRLAGYRRCRKRRRAPRRTAGCSQLSARRPLTASRAAPPRRGAHARPAWLGVERRQRRAPPCLAFTDAPATAARLRAVFAARRAPAVTRHGGVARGWACTAIQFCAPLEVLCAIRVLKLQSFSLTAPVLCASVLCAAPRVPARAFFRGVF